MTLLAEADVLFRWTDHSLSITGWGVFLLVLIAVLIGHDS